MNDLFKLKEIFLNCDKYKLNLNISKCNQNTFGYEIVKILGQTVPYEVI